MHYEGFTEATRVDDGVPNIRLTFDAIDPPFGYTFTNYTVNLWVEDTKNRLAGSTYLSGRGAKGYARHIGW